MSARKRLYLLCFIILLAFLPRLIFAASCAGPSSLASATIAKALGWICSNENQCGGYYLEPPFIYPESVQQNNAIEITGRQGLFSRRSTSELKGNVTITRTGQQVTANKAVLYRNPKTGKLQVIDLIGDVHLREPNTLVVAMEGRYNLETEAKSLTNIYYRTALAPGRKMVGPHIPLAAMQQERKITGLTAWGNADEFYSNEAKVYNLSRSSFSTCPPIRPVWQIKASHIEINKNVGRGYAWHARLLVRDIPIFYVPYLSFSLDKQRKSGFLWPTVGLFSNKWGPYFFTPFYWNMAPNYDMTITPGYLTKRGAVISDTFRYLSHIGRGKLFGSVIPNDKAFRKFQSDVKKNPKAANPPAGQSAHITQAEINRLLNASDTRRGLSWRDDSRYNKHWSSHVDFNYASDDYYLRDFGRNISEISQNQLLQEGDLYYSGLNWKFTGRVQSYQTLHPVNENFVANQYRRLPQLILNADYPDQLYGLEFFMSSELTHFDILKDPGIDLKKPIGNRVHFQPGVSLPLYWPYFYFNPRIQFALTTYNLRHGTDTHVPRNKQRGLPIFDIATGFSFTRPVSLFYQLFQQTLEPQFYYTYIPFSNQKRIPTFDTTVNMLTYDQIFNYNRFTGIDRIGDANQLGMGVTSRFIEQDLGLEKVRLGLGGIVYFAKRRVTLCNDKSCLDNPTNPNNKRTLSPLSAFLNYSVNPHWIFTSQIIWNVYSKLIDNTTLALHYQPSPERIINFSFSYARNDDIFSGIIVNTARNNVKVTDISFAWPVFYGISALGRWSQDWNGQHFQNLLYGLQYDTCCWAARLVGGKAFTGLVNNKPRYNSQFYIQFDLKGLGNIGSDPSRLLKSIVGYNQQFGQEI